MSFIFGFLLGGVIGFGLMCLIIVGKRGEDCMACGRKGKGGKRK